MFPKKVSRHLLPFFLSVAALFGAGCDTGTQQAILPSQTQAPTQAAPIAQPEPVVNKKLSIAYSPQSEKLVTQVLSGVNESTCVWNYTGGNRAIPYQETTKSTQAHSIAILLDGLSSDVTVLCRDDAGATYSGTYSLEKASEDIQSQLTQQPAPAPTPTPTPVPTYAPNGTYKNVYGSDVPSPYAAPSAPAGASAQCADGTYSFSQNRRGTCSHHGGVAEWLY